MHLKEEDINASLAVVGSCPSMLIRTILNIARKKDEERNTD